MRKRYVAKSIPFKIGAVAYLFIGSGWVLRTHQIIRSVGAQGTRPRRSVSALKEGGIQIVFGEPARRTNGEEIPLKSPWRRSSRAMVTSAWKVDRYRAFGDGFWNLYFTFLRFRGIYDKSPCCWLLPRYSPVSKGNPTTRPEMPAAVPARKSRVGSRLSENNIMVKLEQQVDWISWISYHCCLARPTWTSSQASGSCSIDRTVTDRRRR